MVLNSCSRPAAAQTELFTIHNGISVDFTVTLHTDLHTKMLTVTQWRETTHSRACDNVDWSFGVHVRLFSAAIEYLQGAKHNKFGTLVYNRGMQGWRMGWSKNAPADLITIHRPQPLIRVLMCPQLHIHSCGGKKKPFHRWEAYTNSSVVQLKVPQNLCLFNLQISQQTTKPYDQRNKTWQRFITN